MQIDAINAMGDPAARARAAHEMLRSLEADRARLLRARRDAVRRLRDGGWTWQQIASLLGIHRNRAAHLLDR